MLECKCKKCKVCVNSYQKEWRQKNILRAREISNKSQRTLRQKILEHYSGSTPAKCVICGESRYMCLELDHINNDGAEHGKRLCKTEGYRMYRGVNSYIYRDIKKNGYPIGYQTLCANCHRVKTYGENNAIS